MSCSVRKTYVKVTADFYPDGRLRPVTMTWTDGRVFEIDRISDIRRAASLKAGGTGLRYTCFICGRMCYLYYEENYKWFVEEKVGDDGN